MNSLVWVGLVCGLYGCTLKNKTGPKMEGNLTTQTFSTEIEKLVWLQFVANQSMTLSIRCIFESLNHQCYLGSSNDHPITIDDTRLGIPLSEEQTTEGWVQVEGVWKPEPDELSVEQVDFRINKVLSSPPSPLLVSLTRE